jgi:hypothetical protein
MRCRLALLLSGLLSMASLATAQTVDEHAANDLRSSITAARCQYTSADEACAGLNESSQTKLSDDTKTVAQAPRRMPGPPFRGPRPYPRPSRYPSRSPMWMGPDHGHHTAIGALIGFGLGAAAGAGANTDARSRVAASLLVGSLGALMGAAVGHGVPSFRARNRHRSSPRPDEDEQAARGQKSGVRDQEPVISGQ